MFFFFLNQHKYLLITIKIVLSIMVALNICVSSIHVYLFIQLHPLLRDDEV